ncbi:MAG TPA: M67 family metallopeptidase [Anaerolineaceae bacterium]|nr:M67 family metallopeptidase [Anaerolineaceae bacterium]
MALSIGSGERAIMQQHVLRCLPTEACGLLGGLDQTVTAAIPITNRLHSPTRFVMEPLEMLRAFRWLEEHELKLLGIYHSHPSGPAHPSPTDLTELASWEAAILIWSPAGPGWQARAFYLRPEGYEPVPIHWIDQAPQPPAETGV